MDKHHIPDVPLYQKGSREEEAELTLKHTTVSRPMALTLVLIFMATLLAVPVLQQFVKRNNPIAIRRDDGRRLPTPARIKEFETALENESVSAQFLLPRVQGVLIRLGAGNEKTYCGRDGWLFYRPEVDYLTAAGFLEPQVLRKREQSGIEPIQPDPRKAILRFRDQLAARGTALIVMPVPCKPAIHPERFSESCAGLPHPLRNPSFSAFARELAKNGVPVFDCAQMLVDRKRKTGQPQYLATDTHWRPDAMEAVAEQMKAFIQARITLPERPSMNYARGEQTVTNRGDLAMMLKLLPSQTIYARQTVAIHPVTARDRNPWRSDSAADVLVLGDSFCNIYSLDAMGWGENAGLVEQLSFALQRPLDRLVINDRGAYASRALLARELARGRDRLAGKKLVIWEFAERELAEGDWKPMDLTPGKAVASRFFVPHTGTTWAVQATVKDIAPAPQPGTVPYKDHIVAAHLVDITAGTPAIRDGQALVYLSSMRDNVWTPAARLRPGDAVSIILRSWSDVASRYERINRTELPDEDLQLAEPCWGELAPANVH